MTDRSLLPLDIRLLEIPVAVRTDDAAAHERLALWYEPCRFRRPPGPERKNAVAAAIMHEGGAWRSEVDGRPVHVETDLGLAVAALNHEILHAVMERRTDLFFIHAAVVAFGDRAIALPGLSRAGKSTLAAALVARGAQLLSDELLAYDPTEGRVLAVPRALKIRVVCVPYFPEWEHALIGDGDGRLLPFSALEVDAVRPSAALVCVVAPHWDAAADDALVPLSKGLALLRLTESALNFGVRRAASIDVLAQMIGGVRSFALEWRDPHAAAKAIVEALEDDS